MDAKNVNIILLITIFNLCLMQRNTAASKIDDDVITLLW